MLNKIFKKRSKPSTTQDESNTRPSHIEFCEGGSDASTPGTSTAVAIDDIERARDHPTEENIGYTRLEEVDAEIASRAPEEGRSESRRAPVILTQVVKESGFGPLKALLGAISAVYTDRGGTTVARNEIRGLIPRITSLDAQFATLPGDVAERRRRDELIRKAKAIEGQLRSLYGNSGSQQLGHRVEGDEEVLALLGDLEEATFHYQMARRTAIDGQGSNQIDSAEAAALNNFHCAQQAEFRHGSRNGCLKGTRRDVLADIELWAHDFREPPVYWLNGLAGTGKSTVAQTIAERMFAGGQLGASFFCSRDFEDRSNLQFIFPTLAVQLARTYAEFRSIFVPLVQSDPGIAHESLYGQMNKLIVQPLVKSAISTVIVIDALDECKDNEPASAILSVLGQFVSKVPKVKFFVTGRPEPRIREGFRLPLLADATDVFVLHGVEPARVNNDIRQFFRHNFSELKERRRTLDDWPTEEQLDALCDRAGGLFVHAVATVRFVDHRNSNPKRQLDRLLQSPGSSAFEGKTKFRVNATLDLLYMTILHEAFGDDDPEDDPKVRSILGAVVLSANPLSPSTIAALLDFDAEDVFPLLSSIHSLLVLQEDINHIVRPFHKSFPDFIVDPARCANPRFQVSPPDQHLELLVGCLELMNRRLEQNMCKLPDGVTNSEVGDLRERVEQHIDKDLEYACRSWHTHLVDTIPAWVLKILRRFLENKFLFWLEVLSVLGAAREAPDALEATQKWLDESPTLDLVRDYFRFVIAFFDIISLSAPHIYISALTLSPRKSILRGLYKQYARPLVRVVQGLPVSWDPVVAYVFDGSLGSVTAWSPCSKFIAVRSFETTEVRDAVTLKRVGAFESPNSSAGMLSFSPDTHFLAQFNDKGFTYWDLQTGGPACTIPLKSDTRRTVFLSSTYSADGKVVAVAYEKGHDTFVVTYDLLSGTHPHPYHVSEGSLIRPIWTHGDRLRFATVKRESITVWEVPFTLICTPTEVESLPTPDKTIHARNSLFLPTLSRLAFAYQDTVFIWDAKASELLLNSGPIQSQVADGHKMSFSSDGGFFAHTVRGCEAYIWRESLTGYTLHQKFSLTAIDRHAAPYLSPNGKSVVSHGESIQLWHTKDQILSPPGVPTRKDTDLILRFSSDEKLVAFAYLLGDTVTILDLKSGDPWLLIDPGMEVWCLGMTGNTIVVIDNERIATWNLHARDCAPNTRLNISDSVQIATFDFLGPSSDPLEAHIPLSISPDLSRFAIVVFTHFPEYRSLKIYDVSTGRYLTCIDTDRVLNPWFTSNGHQVWDANGSPEQGWEIIEDRETGVTKLELLEQTSSPPGIFPWQPLRGYEVTDDGWVLGSTRKRLLWLPHQWRSTDKRYRRWSGRFLGLMQGGLPEVVILEFLE